MACITEVGTAYADRKKAEAEAKAKQESANAKRKETIAKKAEGK